MPEAEDLRSANASSAQRASFFQMKARLQCTLTMQLRRKEWVSVLYREIKKCFKVYNKPDFKQRWYQSDPLEILRLNILKRILLPSAKWMHKTHKTSLKC